MLRITEKTPPKKIFQTAKGLYDLRLLAMLIIIPLYAVLSNFAGQNIKILPLTILVFVELLNMPYQNFYTNYESAIKNMVVSLLIDFLVVTFALSLMGGKDVFILTAFYVVIIFYCSVYLSKSLSFMMATFATFMFGALTFAGRFGITVEAFDLIDETGLLPQISVFLRHSAFFYLIAFLSHSLVKQVEEREAKVNQFISDLRRTNENIKKSQETQASYFANASHEIKSPLSSIDGYAQLLTNDENNKLSEEQLDYVARIKKNVGFVNTILIDVIEVVRLKFQKEKLDLSDFNIKTALENTLDIFFQDAMDKDINLHLDVPIKDRFEIKADEMKIKQIFYNLISNALKFTDEQGEIKVELKKEGTFYMVSVQDNGQGIETKYHETIFKAFEQGPQSEKEKQESQGSGLGLAISKQFAELHGGRISLKSHYGVGSTFTVSLPVVAIEQEIQKEEDESLKEPKSPFEEDEE